MRFNQRQHQPTTINHEGTKAYVLPDKAQLITSVTNSFMYGSYYKSQSQELQDFQDVVRNVAAEDPEFVLRTAAYARSIMNMRTSAVLLLVVAANIPTCKPFVRQWATHVIRRPDEIQEVMGAQMEMYGKPIPNSIKKAIGDAFERFNEYRLEKWNKTGVQYSFGNVLRMVHPKGSTPEKGALFHYLVHGWDNLSPEQKKLLPYIKAKKQFSKLKSFGPKAQQLLLKYKFPWENVISKFPEAWEHVEFPYMAGLRNLRNLIEKASKDKVRSVCDMIRNPERVASGKQLPFRYYSALKALGTTAGPGYGFVQDALEEAVEHSIGNIDLPGSSFITCDVSASMTFSLSPRSDMTPKEIGLLFGAALARASKDNILSVFGQNHVVVPVQNSVLSTMKYADGMNVGHSTNAHLALEWLIHNKKKVDRVVIFSDMQVYTTFGYTYGYDGALKPLWKKYKKEVNPEARLYSFDLNTYGSSQFADGDPSVTLLAGWSSQALRNIKLSEQDPRGIVQLVNDYCPS